ncbi:transposase family protein [Streptomyces sp. Tu 3180]|uniref:transposase family protein n=1 Tax=Streptomyces sp. Tu 3180 TaxID=2682611 RepID=UPI001FB713C9|nr:transposase family protein [Streptomyces sp. Tu 3180]
MTLLALTACAVLAGARSLLAVSEWVADTPSALSGRRGVPRCGGAGVAGRVVSGAGRAPCLAWRVARLHTEDPAPAPALLPSLQAAPGRNWSGRLRPCRFIHARRRRRILVRRPLRGPDVPGLDDEEDGICCKPTVCCGPRGVAAPLGAFARVRVRSWRCRRSGRPHDPAPVGRPGPHGGAL